MYISGYQAAFPDSKTLSASEILYWKFASYKSCAVSLDPEPRPVIQDHS